MYNHTATRNSSEAAIIRTLLYSSVFSFPLTKNEMWQLLKTPTPVTKKEFESSLYNLLKHKVVYATQQFYALEKCNASDRKRKIIISNKKYKQAVTIANILSHIPTILFIGISGSLALKSAEEDDDIDFFIITERRALWPTRLLILTILELLQMRRKRGAKNTKNTVCANMLLDEDALAFTGKRKNIYTAHEIAQMKPLVNKRGIFQHFLQANIWTRKHMPNIKHDYKITRIHDIFLLSSILHHVLTSPLVILITKYIQLVYMQRSRTTEEVTDSLAAFHPSDYMSSTLAQYAALLKKNLPS